MLSILPPLPHPLPHNNTPPALSRLLRLLQAYAFPWRVGMRADSFPSAQRYVLQTLSGPVPFTGGSQGNTAWGNIKTHTHYNCDARASGGALRAVPRGHIPHIIFATPAVLCRASFPATARARWVEARLADVVGEVPGVVGERLCRPVSAPRASGSLAFFASPFARLPFLACLHGEGTPGQAPPALTAGVWLPAVST